MNTNKWIRNQLTNGIIFVEQYLEKNAVQRTQARTWTWTMPNRKNERDNKSMKRERERHLFCIIKFGLFQPLCVNNSENIFVPIACSYKKKEFNGTYFIISCVLLFSFNVDRHASFWCSGSVHEITPTNLNQRRASRGEEPRKKQLTHAQRTM